MPTLSEILDSLPTYMAEQKEERRQAIDDWSKRKPSVEAAWENIPARRAAQHRYDLNQANYAVPGEENRGEAQEAAWQDYDRFNLTRNQLNQERAKRAESFKTKQLEQANNLRENLREAQLYAQDARKRDGREEAAWGQMQENRLAAANEALPGEVGRDGPTEALWKAKDRLKERQAAINDYSDKFNTQLTEDEEKQYQAWAKQIGHERDVYDYDLRGAWKAGAAQAENGHFPDTFKKPNHPTFSVESKYHDGKKYVGGRWVVEDGQNIFIGPNGERRDDNGKLLSEGTTQPQKAPTAETGNGEFSTATTVPSSTDGRWGVKFDPNETAKFLFGEGILSQPMAIPDVSSRGKTQITPQMAQQVQALEQVYSTRDPRLIPGNPQFDMFAFADYLMGLRAKNQALYQQRMGGAMQGGYAGAQAPQISSEMMAEYQGQLSEAKQLGLQGGIDRYGNRVFYDPRTKRIFKSVAEYKQSISTNNPSAAPSAGERSDMGIDY